MALSAHRAEQFVKLPCDICGLQVQVQVLLGLAEGRVAREGKELVCGDTGCDSRVPEARLPGQLFHALG